MNHIVTLKNILAHLDLLEATAQQDTHLSTACNWALNTEGYVLQPYSAVALRPVLATLKKARTQQYIPAKSLTLTKGELMPQNTPTLLSTQLDKLKNELHGAKDSELWTVLEREASTLAVNSIYNDLPLFDFIKTTVGIAECLKNGNGQLRLVGCSLSGIQTYLYDIVSKNAARQLKGRSFYIQLLVDSLLDRCLSHFGLTDCHVVYSSGGGFYCLLPDTEGVENKFLAFSKSISEQIYAVHKTQLFVELAISEPFNQQEQIEGNNGIWDTLIKKLNAHKNKRLTQNEALLDDFFKIIEFGGTRQRDPITNEEYDEHDRASLTKLLDGTTVLKSTKQQIDLGGQLRKAKFWFTSTQNNYDSPTLKDPFGVFHYLKENLPTSISANTKVKKINDLSGVTSFTFYGGNRFPVFQNRKEDSEGNVLHYEGEIMPFEYLVEGQRFTRLGILRMDVDGLGSIFSEGIADIDTPQYKVNFTRYAATSRSLDFFFKGYLNTLQRQYEDSTVIIYSGGDDLFIVGKWNDVLQLAQDINKAFSDWSCGNLSISGGIVLLPPKFPIMQGARLADDAEKEAKKRKDVKAKKDAAAFCLFDKALKWDAEFKIVKELFELLMPFFDADSDKPRLHRSILTKIDSYAELDKAYRTGKVNSPSWRWQMAYDLSRFRDTVKGDAKDVVKQIMTDAFADTYNGSKHNSSYTYLELLQMAVRWIEFETRTENE